MLGAGVHLGDGASAPDTLGPLSLERVVSERYLPFAIVLILAGGAQRALADRLPWIAAMGAGGAALAYVCRRFVCRQPAATPDALRADLAAL